MCGQENADYAFLMDASRSILPDEFQLVKNYVKDVIDYLSIGPALTHVGVIEYSKSAKMELAFDKSYDREEIKRIVDKVPHTKGITRIDLALQVASQELFTAAIGGMRNTSRKVKCLNFNQGLFLSTYRGFEYFSNVCFLCAGRPGLVLLEISA